MRTLQFPNDTDLRAAIARLNKEYDQRSAHFLTLEDQACRWLETQVSEQRIVSRTFEIYVAELTQLLATVAGHSVSSDNFRDAVATAIAKTTEGSRRRLRCKVLLRVLKFGQQSVPAYPTWHESAQEAVVRGSKVVRAEAALSDAQIDATVDELKLVHRRTEAVLESIERRHVQPGLVATPPMLARAAMIAMCRYAGARAGDLETLSIGDLTTSDTSAAGAAIPSPYTGLTSLAKVWTVVRVERGAVGEDKRKVVQLRLDRRAAKFLVYHLDTTFSPAARAAGIAPDTPVFQVVREKAGEVHRLPMTRKEVFRIIAGIDEDARLAHEHALAATDPRARETSVLDQPRVNQGEPDAVKLNPSLLLQCLALEVTDEFHRYGKADHAEVAARLGWSKEGQLRTYRHLLRIKGRVTRLERGTWATV